MARRTPTEGDILSGSARRDYSPTLLLHSLSPEGLPAESATVKGLPVVTIYNGAVHLVGLKQSLARKLNPSRCEERRE